MKVSFSLLSNTVFLSVLLLLSASTSALQCKGVPSELSVVVHTKQSAESSTPDCALEGESAIHLTGTLSSSLLRARAYVEARFFDRQGNRLGTVRRGPWLGIFSGLALDESIAVPLDAARVLVAARFETSRQDATGEWRISKFAISSGVVVIGDAAQDPVITTAQIPRWNLSTIPVGAQGKFQVELRDPFGQLSATRTVQKTSTQTEIDFGPLPVGYYQLQAKFSSEREHLGTWTNTLVVLPEGIPPNEPRFGMDAALSQMGGTPDMIERSLGMMRQAGIGAVRDRLSWNQVQPVRGQTNWEHYEKVARAVIRAKMEPLQMFHDSPVWAHPGGSTQTDRQMPLNDTAVFEFGQAYAKGLGRTVRSIEYWNEQNISGFFAGRPFQYASGFKAFSAGVKSVDPGIRVLIGGAADRPGRFFEEIYRNGVANFLDTRNQHYYGKDADIPSFFDRHLAALERNGGIEGWPGWITEMGYALRRDSHGDWLATERKQAEYLVKTYASSFATAYERVFFFFWREYIEAEHHTWGIVRGDFSPRPAYLTLALLTRHLAGASVVASESHGTGRTLYFRHKNGELVAVTWGGGAPMSRLGSKTEIQNIFGQRLNRSSAEANGSEPLLLSRIDQLPAGTQAVKLPKQAIHELPVLRLSARLRIDGQDRTSPSSPSDDRIAVDVVEGGIVEIAGRAYSNTSTVKPSIDCLPGPGLSVLSPAKIDGEVFICRFQAKLAKQGESYASVQAKSGKHSDIVRIALIPEAASVGLTLPSHPLMPDKACLRWTAQHSTNLSLMIEPTDGKPGLCSVKVSSRIGQQGDSWVFPAAQIHANELSTATGLRLRIGNVFGMPPPPTPIMLQLAEHRGKVWRIDLKRGENSEVYTALFKLAKAAPWGRVNDDIPLDLANVRKIIVGWGGYNGRAGQQHGFIIKEIDVLKENQQE